MNERRMEERIVFVSLAIFVLAAMMFYKFRDNINKVRDASSETKNILYILMVYATLFETEKFFQTKDKEFTSKFKKRLELNIQDITCIHSKKLIEEFQCAKNSAKHFSRKALKILKIENTTKTTEFTTTYLSYLDSDFYDILTKAWLQTELDKSVKKNKKT